MAASPSRRLLIAGTESPASKAGLSVQMRGQLFSGVPLPLRLPLPAIEE